MQIHKVFSPVKDFRQKIGSYYVITDDSCLHIDAEVSLMQMWVSGIWFYPYMFIMVLNAPRAKEHTSVKATVTAIFLRIGLCCRTQLTKSARRWWSAAINAWTLSKSHRHVMNYDPWRICPKARALALGWSATISIILCFTIVVLVVLEWPAFDLESRKDLVSATFYRENTACTLKLPFCYLCLQLRIWNHIGIFRISKLL